MRDSMTRTSGMPKRKFNLPRIGDRRGLRELGSALDSEIFGDDDRIPVTDSTKFPYRFICHLLIGMTSADGDVATGVGSGTLISNRHVLTVGHNLRLQLNGKVFSAKKITVTPGRNTSLSDQAAWAPFQSYVARSWATSESMEVVLRLAVRLRTHHPAGGCRQEDLRFAGRQPAWILGQPTLGLWEPAHGTHFSRPERQGCQRLWLPGRQVRLRQ
ncbi:MAG: hypothetical protein QM757_34645 [Paludibaculum sp.]